jgi:hypothetical protein
MMLMLSPEDFRQLSPACQQELLGLLTRDSAPTPPPSASLDESAPEWETDEYLADEDAAPYFADIVTPAALTPERPALQDAADSTNKQVLEISVATARDLIANISDKSLTVLTQFANGQPVALAGLMGANAPYRDMNELKRSLVGAVNRRLRTVTENRAAVLFASSRDRQHIYITPRSAASLRQAMRLAEPTPELIFVGANTGVLLHQSDPAAHALAQRIHTSWQQISVRPLEPRHQLLPAQVFQYLHTQGFALYGGKPITDEAGRHHYEWMPQIPTTNALLALIDPQGNARLNNEDGVLRLKIFAGHPECAEARVTLASV